MPLSLTPAATERTVLGVLPAISLFLAIPLLPVTGQRRLMHAAIVIGILDVFVGLGQVIGGEASSFRFYAGASRTDAVGFFANRNHHALFLAILIPLVGALASSRLQKTSARMWLASAVAILLLGIAACGSRAGLALGAIASIATLYIAVAASVGRRSDRAVTVWGLLAAVSLLLSLVVFGAIGDRLTLNNVSGDLRWQIARTTWRALSTVWPAGSGFGSFQRFYASFEPQGELIGPIINNAHDDWLEVTLEGGLAAQVFLFAALAYLVVQTVKRRPKVNVPCFATAVRSATLLILWLCALHSTVDYPLRTMAVNVLVALACGLRVAASKQASLDSMIETIDPPMRMTSSRGLPRRSRQLAGPP